MSGKLWSQSLIYKAIREWAHNSISFKMATAPTYHNSLSLFSIFNGTTIE
jgi:hypothetical protein